jgi:hypothetical protein
MSNYKITLDNINVAGWYNQNLVYSGNTFPNASGIVALDALNLTIKKVEQIIALKKNIQQQMEMLVF